MNARSGPDRAAAERAPERLIPSARQVAVGLVVAALVVAGLGALLARAAGFDEVADAVERADARWLAVCLAAQMLALAGYVAVVREAFRWRGGIDPGWRLSAHVLLASMGANRVLPAGGIGGLAVAYWSFRRAASTATDALVRVLGVNALFYVVFGVGAWASALALALRGDAPVGLTAPWLVGVPACFSVAALLARLTHAFGVALGGSFPRRGLAIAVAAVAWVTDVLAGGRPGIRMLLASCVYWLGHVACLWAAVSAVGAGLSVPELLLAFATGQVVVLLPLPLGGAGGVDAAMTYALTLVGVALAPALVAVAVYRLFAFWLPTVPALAALALLRGAGRALERAAAAGA